MHSTHSISHRLFWRVLCFWLWWTGRGMGSDRITQRWQTGLKRSTRSLQGEFVSSDPVSWHYILADPPHSKRSCSLSLLSLPDFSPSTFQQRLIRWRTTPSESWVMLSVDPTFPKQAISSAFSSNHLLTLLSLIHVTPQIPSAVLPIACHSAPIQH